MSEIKFNECFELCTNEELLDIDGGGIKEFFEGAVEFVKEVASVIPTKGKVIWGTAYYVGNRYMPDYSGSGKVIY